MNFDVRVIGQRVGLLVIDDSRRRMVYIHVYLGWPVICGVKLREDYMYGPSGSVLRRWGQGVCFSQSEVCSPNEIYGECKWTP